MSFAGDTRSEIAHIECNSLCCARSELCAALMASGGISYHGRGRYGLSLTASDATIVRRYFTMVKRFFDVTGELRVLKTDQLSGMTRYQLVLPEGKSLFLLEELQLLDPEGLFGLRDICTPQILENDCCKASFLRAAFLFCGTITNPEKAYHIEFSAPNQQFAQNIMELLRKFEINAKNTCRKAKEVVYLKGSDGITDVLTLLGAYKSMLEMENIRIKKGLHNQVNRQMNCDSSNINRSMLTAERQIADITYIDDVLGLHKLPKTLRDVAQARLENPEISLSGLGELMVPQLGKSGVNSRLRRLTELANRLRSGEEIDF